MERRATIDNNDVSDEVRMLARRARQAAREASQLTAGDKNRALDRMAAAIYADREAIMEANDRDMRAAQQTGEAGGRLDRLRLTEERIAGMIEGLRQIALLDDPVGERVEELRPANGLRIEQVRVPIGVIGIVYEARPNVTVDAAALTVKTGNAVILRGGSEAFHSNRALVLALRKGLEGAGLAPDLVLLIESTERASVDALITARGFVDVVIPRGGAGLIDRVVRHASVPVIETGVGNCHVYVDREADVQMAVAITVNAKAQRPSVCNAAETLLVHESIARDFLPSAALALAERGVELRLDERASAVLRAVLDDSRVSGMRLREATEEDYATEYNDFILAVKVVSSLDEALDHIARYGTKHSEAIVTASEAAAATFLRDVDAAVVYHNASTRFTDGYEFGFGAEIGVSTQKLHARGPMGLRALTSCKYVVKGGGQTRGE